MSFRTHSAAVATIAALVFCTHQAGAQGTLSTQGLGYSTGELSARASALGGSVGEIDAGSQLNPASLGAYPYKALSFLLQPEFRTVVVDSSTERTRIARYPSVFVIVPMGAHWVASLGASTLLDRSWATTRSEIENIGDDTTLALVHDAANGAMNDARLALAWSPRNWLKLGAGVHAITGRNVVSSGREFADSVHFNTYTQSQTIGFRGSAMSVGAEVLVGEIGEIGVDYRRGFDLRALSAVNDSLLARGRAPDHVGASIQWTLLRGTTVSGRLAHDGWSSLGPLSLDTPAPHDTWDYGAGAEVAGGHFQGSPVQFRFGLRSRDLPYEADGAFVHERSGSLGASGILGAGRVVMDGAIVYAVRSASIPVSEHAWTFSLGLTIRP